MSPEEQLKQIDQYTKQQLQNDFTGHDYAHIIRVVKMAHKLSKLQSSSVNEFIVEAASLLHDVIDEKLVDDVNVAQATVRNFLTELKVTSSDIDAIFDIITHMSFSKNLEHHYELTLEGQIVQDADRLDAIGAIGIARTFYYGGSHQHIMYDPSIKPRTAMTHAEYRNNETVINHFYEKLLKLKDSMNTDAASQIAKERTQFLEIFLQQFKQEWIQER